MPSFHTPTVFVSSTCYDLSQIRDNLKCFIESYGFHPMLSEFSSFPIDTSQNTIENCCRNIEEGADIFILIVGSRYGSTNSDGKSITNLEYLQARAKGIPIYVFISRTIIDQLPVWKDNPHATFSHVDTPKLFEFAHTLRNLDGLWTYPFDKTKDITETLQQQWAFLFNDAMKLWRKTRDSGIPKSLMELNGEALRLVIEKPSYWEHLLFSQLLKDKLAEYKTLKNDKEYGIKVGKPDHIDAEDPSFFFKWFGSFHQEVIPKIKTISSLLQPEVTENAFGAQGKPGDPEKIIYIADRLSIIYGELLHWSIRCANIITDKKFDRFLNLHSRGVDNVVQEIENFSDCILNEINNVKNIPPTEVKPLQITLTLKMTFPEKLEEELSSEYKRLSAELGGDLGDEIE